MIFAGNCLRLRSTLVVAFMLVLCGVLYDVRVLSQDQPKKPSVVLDLESNEVKQAALYFLGKLRDLSDTGVYETLKIQKILSAKRRKGVYHDIVELEIILESDDLEEYEVDIVHKALVLKNLDDGAVSIAIDEFPDMRPEAIEAYRIRKIMRAKLERKRVLKELLESGLRDYKVKS